MDDQQEEPPTSRGTVRTWWHTMPSPIRWRRVIIFVALVAIGVALVVVGGIQVANAGSIARADSADVIATIAGITIVLATPPIVLRSMTVDLRDIQNTLDGDSRHPRTLRSLLGFDDDQRTDHDDDTAGGH